jgi:hypothetical protein
MAPSRHEFIKFVVAGSVAAGGPLDETLIAASDWSKKRSSRCWTDL